MRLTFEKRQVCGEIVQIFDKIFWKSSENGFKKVLKNRSEM